MKGNNSFRRDNDKICFSPMFEVPQDVHKTVNYVEARNI